MTAIFKSVCTSNFDEIAQSTAKLLLFQICENGRLLYCNSISGFDFDLLIVIGMVFFIGVLNLNFLASTVPEI